MNISTILVVGAGTMGSSIAQVFASYGYKTYMSCRHSDHLTEAVKKFTSVHVNS